MRYRVVLLTALIPGICAAADLMPAARQNALVQKHCVMCHTDALRYGGLSLDRFDAARPPPSQIAMMLSKLTGGVALKTVIEAPTNPTAAAHVERGVKSGAMGASGVPRPDRETLGALIQAFATESQDA